MKKNYNQRKMRTGIAALGLLFCGMFANTIMAQNYAWNGSVDSNWSTPGNWTNSGITKATVPLTADSFTFTLPTAINSNQIAVGDIVSTTVPATTGYFTTGTVVTAVSVSITTPATGTTSAVYSQTITVDQKILQTTASATVRFIRATPSFPGATPGDSAVISNGTCNLDIDTTIIQLNLNTVIAPANGQGVLIIPSGKTLNIGSATTTSFFGQLSSAIFIRGGRLENAGTLNLIPQAANAGINLQAPVWTSVTDSGYKGLGILNIMATVSGGGITFNNGNVTPIPYVTLNEATTTITLETGNAIGLNANGRGLINGTGLTIGSTATPVIGRLMNLTGGTSGSNLEVSAGTVLTLNAAPTSNTAITFTGVASTSVILDNKGTINLNGASSTAILGNTTTTSTLNNSGTITLNSTAGTANAIPATVTNLINTGKISTNAGSTINTNLNAASNTFTSGTLSPGGDMAKGVMNVAGATVAFGTSTLKLNVSGIETSVAGTDFDQINATTAAAAINLTGTVLDLTGITSTANTTIDLITTNAGTITGTPTTVPAVLPMYWTMTNTGDKIQLTYNNPLSVSSKKAFEFSVYPNPVNDVINIQTQENVKGAQIIDAAGKVVLSQKNPSNSLNVSSLNKGIYILKLSSDKGISTSKIMKK